MGEITEVERLKLLMLKLEHRIERAEFELADNKKELEWIKAELTHSDYFR